MSVDFNNWLEQINKHYGNVHNFDDATTIRTMRNTLSLILDNHMVIIEECIEDDQEIEQPDLFDQETSQQTYEDVFLEEIEGIKAGIKLMDEWLEKRGLEL